MSFMRQRYHLLLWGYIFSSLLLFLYSYTQVDLNLTLSRINIWQSIQKTFQYLGYFQRPTSTAIYIGILVLFFGLYGVLLRSVRQGLVTTKQLWKLILVVGAILLLSYPAFSYDLFNYMFDAKTILVYHKSPYLVMPRDFAPVDPWLNFMRWVHLPSAYAPLWIALTLPSYFLGFGYFLLILWNLKAMILGFYLLCVWGIGRILAQVDPKRQTLGMAIFALNPLVVIESLVSSHNDIVMMAMAMLAIYLLLEKKKITAWLVLSLSVAVKLMTIFLAPVFLVMYRRNLNWRLASLALMLLGFTLVLFRREVLPWYWVWIMPFVALLPNWNNLILPAGGVSLGLLLRYAPFLYLGNWDSPVPVIKDALTIVPIALAVFTVFLVSRRKTGDKTISAD